MSKAALRNLWFQFHKWIGLGLLVLIIPISLSGSALVWHDALDAAINPSRYAVSKGPAKPLPELADAAKAAAQLGERLSQIRIEEGGPAVATLVAPAQNGPPKRTSLWIDPANGRVLDRAGANEGAVRFLHDLHGSLLVSGVGRQVVGWIGVAMLISSLTGIWLWWPLTGRLSRGLRWKRRPTTNANLHYTLGFWIAIPLAMLSFTGVWISFPAVFAPLVGAKAPDPGERQRRMSALPLTQTVTTSERAVAAAQSVQPGKPASLQFPTDKSGEWQIGIASGDGAPISVKVPDASGVAEKPKPREPTPVARTMRVLHDGTGMGFVWQFVIFLGGIIPAILAITGLIMWLRERKKSSPRAA